MPDRLKPSELRLLLAVLSLHQRGEHLTMRSAVREAGWSGTVGYHERSLRRLRDAGLITWEENRSGTLRLTCRLEVIR